MNLASELLQSYKVENNDNDLGQREISQICNTYIITKEQRNKI